MSAIGSLQIAIDAAILTDVVLASKLGGQKVYSLRVPESDDVFVTGRAYIVLGQSVETAEYNFDGRGDRGMETISIWSNDLSKMTVAEIAADLERILDNKPLTMTGRRMVIGIFNVVALDLDPSGKYSFASCRYEVLTYGA